ncbi:MAG: phosphate ABC transporter permease PstA [Phycisphaerales bacterium]|nr:phosphate ABC transporter permease PstA [Phycisphaerales bacterium]
MSTLHDRAKRLTSAAAYAGSIACAVVIVGVLLLVLADLVRRGAGGLSWAFFAADAQGEPAGMRHAIEGTLILVALASAVGVPTGVLAGVYLSEYSKERWLATPVRFTADVLAGVPSIVVGILGYELLVVPLTGYSAWAGAAGLAFIMIPIVARTTEEMLRLVPHSYREASIALGGTKSQTILRVVLPGASGSIVTGIILALARIAGETAPLLFTILGASMITRDPSKPFPALTHQIYVWANSPDPSRRDMAFAGMLVLIAVVFAISLGIRLTVARAQRRR